MRRRSPIRSLTMVDEHCDIQRSSEAELVHRKQVHLVRIKHDDRNAVVVKFVLTLTLDTKHRDMGCTWRQRTSY